MNFLIDKSQVSLQNVDYIYNILSQNLFLSTTGGFLTGNLKINTSGTLLEIYGDITGGQNIFLDSISNNIGIGISSPSGMMHIFNTGNVSIYIDPDYPNLSESSILLKYFESIGKIVRETGGNIKLGITGEDQYLTISFIDKNSNIYFKDNNDSIYFNKIELKNNSTIDNIFKSGNYKINNFQYISGSGFNHYLVIDRIDLNQNAGAYYDLKLYETGEKYVGSFQNNISYAISDQFNTKSKYSMNGVDYFNYSGKDASGNIWSTNINIHPYQFCSILAGSFIATGFATGNLSGNLINPNQEFIPFGKSNNRMQYFSKNDTGKYIIKWDSSKWIFVENNGSNEYLLYKNNNTGLLPYEYGWKLGNEGICPIGEITYISDKIENEKSLIYNMILSGVNSGEYILGKKYLLGKRENIKYYPTGSNNFSIKFDSIIDELYTGNFTIFLKTTVGANTGFNEEIFIKTKNYSPLDNSNKHTNWSFDYNTGISTSGIRFSYINNNATGSQYIPNVNNIITINNNSGIEGSVYLFEINYTGTFSNQSNFEAKYYTDNLQSASNIFLTGNFSNSTGLYFSNSTEIYQTNNSIYEFGLIDRLLSSGEKQKIFLTSRLQNSVNSGIKFLFKLNDDSNIVTDIISGYTGVIQNASGGTWL